MDIGLIGLPKSGKTTVFNALTRGHATPAAYGGSMEHHVGVVRVPDPRLERLAATLHPQRLVPAEVRYTDFAGPATGSSRDERFSPQLLAQLRLMEVLMPVIRAFPDPRVPHEGGDVDPIRDAGLLELEMIYADLSLLEHRLERITASLRGGRGIERDQLEREGVLLRRLQETLEQEKPLREQPLTAEEERLLSSFQLLTRKPVLAVVNVAEEQLSEGVALEKALADRYRPPRTGVVSFCGQLEMELAQLPEEEAKELREAYGLEETALERAIRLSAQVAGLVTFFTVVSSEVRAWAIAAGTTAGEAAGKIHTDMERGFIRAEVVDAGTLVAAGSWAEVRRRGLLRAEGRDYHVQDGDVMTVLFHVSR